MLISGLNVKDVFIMHNIKCFVTNISKSTYNGKIEYINELGETRNLYWDRLDNLEIEFCGPGNIKITFGDF